MSRFDLRGALLRTSAVAALFTLGATGASAQAPTVLGGGSTLAGPVYATGTGTTILSTVSLTEAANCSSSGDFFYGLVGSGTGIGAFLSNAPAGLGAGCTGAVHYGAGDLPLNSQTPGSAAAFSAANGYQLIQVPTFGTPVTIPFNYAGVGTDVDGDLALTDTDLCNIFSGKVKDFSGLSAAGKSGPIAVSYRQDSSGTSFLLTQHLAAVCPKPINGITFAATTKFATLFPGFNTTVDGTGTSLYTVPSGTFAADVSGKGSGSIKAAVVANAKSVGYVGPDYTDIAPKNAGVAGFPAVATVKGILPTQANTTTALNTVKVKNIVATNPDSYGILVPNPKVGYPIVGYTYVDISSQYQSATVVADIKKFLGAIVNQTGSNSAAYDTITTNGFVVLPGVNRTAVPTAGSVGGSVVKNYLSKNALVKIVTSAGGR